MITASKMDGIATAGKSLNIEDTERGNEETMASDLTALGSINWESHGMNAVRF